MEAHKLVMIMHLKRPLDYVVNQCEISYRTGFKCFRFKYKNTYKDAKHLL